MSGTVRYETDGFVATITLNRPDALNAFDKALRMDLIGATQQARDDDGIRAVVLTGAGRAFSAGADLKAGFGDGRNVERTLNEEYKPSLINLAEMPKPVISAVNGFAAGIGISYAMACDLMVMGESAFLLSPFSNIGLVPDGGSTWLLSRGLGYVRAYQLAVENERLPAQRCVELGLANRAVADADVVSEAQGWAASLAQRAPLALGRTKLAMRAAPALSYADAISNEAALQRLCIDSEDCKEGVAAFLEKRPAVFKGR